MAEAGVTREQAAELAYHCDLWPTEEVIAATVLVLEAAGAVLLAAFEAERHGAKVWKWPGDERP